MQTKLHFLVADSDNVMRHILIAMLRESGYSKISIAGDGEMALRALRAAKIVGAPVDFLITDYSMPLMDGLELAHSIRDTGDQMPILMVSRQATEDNIRAAARVGVDSYYVQPFRATSFKKKVDGLLVEKGLKDKVLEMGVL